MFVVVSLLNLMYSVKIRFDSDTLLQMRKITRQNILEMQPLLCTFFITFILTLQMHQKSIDKHQQSVKTEIHRNVPWPLMI